MDEHFTDHDHALMKKALDLAWLGRYGVSPNPMVGCVIADRNGTVSTGYHRYKGGDHAEIDALKKLPANFNPEQATVYLTLEPCSHQGSTPPCAPVLRDRGFKRVVAAMEDPNPQVSGQGFAILRAAGVQVGIGLMEKEARSLNRSFLSRIEKNRPFVTLKMALSLDGKISLSNGISQWISGETARQDVQEARARSSAILTGINTVLIDNPRLNVRTVSTPRQPIRVILDSNLRIPESAFVVQDDSSPTWIATLERTPLKTKPFLKKNHIRSFTLKANPKGQIALLPFLTLLAKEGINDLYVEAGPTLAGALLEENLVDELIIYRAPIILGHQACDAFFLPRFSKLEEAFHWQLIEEIDCLPDKKNIYQKMV